MLYYQGLLYVPEIIQTELISRYHNNSLADYFGINKICKFVVWKYYWPTFYHDVNNYMKGCNIYLASKVV